MPEEDRLPEPPEDYEIGSQTIDMTDGEDELEEATPVLEVEEELYGKAKPKRVIIRAKITHDSG